jgi:acyl-CoA synthetase (AMP-forming)/AMP-acid ligase II
MWFLHFIPDTWYQLFVHFIVALGIGLGFLGAIAYRIPGISNYGMMIKGLSSIIFMLGIFLEGGFVTEMSWRYKTRETEHQIAQLQLKSDQASHKVVYKYIERTKIVKEKSNAIQSKIPEYVNKEADANCTIPESAIVLHDAAAKNELPDPASGAIKGASNVTLSKLLDTTVLNYGTFYEVREQLKALQDWVREQKKINP